MHEISGSTAVNNHFVDETETQAGTVLSADWLNTVQDELCNLITSVGIPLNSIDNDTKTQLKEGVSQIAQNMVNKTLDDYVKNVHFTKEQLKFTDFADALNKLRDCIEFYK